MKPKGYIKKYNLDNKNAKFNHKTFVQDLAIDFMTMVETHQRYDWTFSKFQVCIKDIRQKFDAIARTGHPHISEKLWKFFYATVVGPAKDEMFGEELEKERRRKKEEYDERQGFYRHWASDFYNAWFGILSSIQAERLMPKNSFDILGLSYSASKEDIKKKYKELVFQHHPDRGGSTKEFREIVEAKNRCLAYIIS